MASSGCARCSKVSRSGYYDWSRRPGPSTPPETRNSRAHHRDPPTLPDTYGAPRVHAELRRLEQRCGKKRVARLMAARGLVGAHARRQWRTGRPDVAPAPDLVNREFTASRPDQIWAADVTQFWTTEGWLYFAGVIDLYSRRVVGWAMSASPDADLVIDALLMGFERRRPDESSFITRTAERFTRRWPSATGPQSSASPVRSGRLGTATTMPRSNRSGPRSSGS